MTDLDERLRAAGEAFREQPVPDVALRWPTEKRPRWLTPIAVAAAVALVVAGVAIVRSVVDSSQPPAAPAGLPAPDRDYAVALPFLGGSGGPGFITPLAECRPIRATATTRVSAEGVVGLVTITTARGCSLQVDTKKLALEGANHEDLGVPISNGNTTNPAFQRANSAGNNGQVSLGFAWAGSYCGPAAKWVGVLSSGPGVADFLSIAMTGPSPSCRPGSASSVLIPGIVGGPHDAVLPPPLAWKSLTAKVVLPKTVDQGPIPLTVVLTNHSSEPISLSAPCTVYGTITFLDVRGHGSQIAGSSGDSCARPLTVEPGRPLPLKLTPLEFPAFSDLPRTKVSSGDQVTVTWSIAGVAPASATTRIR